MISSLSLLESSSGFFNYYMPAIQVVESFSRAALTYDANAIVQSQAAVLLAAVLQDLTASLPPGPVLEIGCGTGLFTQHLVNVCSAHDLLITDIAPAMLDTCKRRLGLNAVIPHSQLSDSDSTSLHFQLLDGEELPQSKRYALIASSFTMQWFTDIAKALTNLTNALRPGGILLFSVPTDRSFVEWRQICTKNNLIYTGNALPATNLFRTYAEQSGYENNFFETTISARYNNSLQFFRSLKKLGASTNSASSASAATVAAQSNLRRLLRAWDNDNHNGTHNENLTVTFDILIGWIRNKEKAERL